MRVDPANSAPRSRTPRPVARPLTTADLRVLQLPTSTYSQIAAAIQRAIDLRLL